jgi:hypothetical protein
MVIVAIGAGAAFLWWLGLAVVVLVVIPLVLFLARDIIRSLVEIRAYSGDILEHGTGLAGALDVDTDLEHTAELTGAARPQLEQYAAGVGRLLGGAR